MTKGGLERLFDRAKEATPKAFHHFLDYWTAKNTNVRAYAEISDNELIFVMNNQGFKKTRNIFYFSNKGLKCYMVEIGNEQDMIVSPESRTKARRKSDLTLSMIIGEQYDFRKRRELENFKRKRVNYCADRFGEPTELDLIQEIVGSEIEGIIGERKSNSQKQEKYMTQLSA